MAPCCPISSIGLCIRDERPCYNRHEYVFWDAVHPGEAWNLLIGTTSYDSSNHLGFAYPMDIKHLVEQEIEMELDSTSQLSASA